MTRVVSQMLRLHREAVPSADNREAFITRPVLVRYLSARRTPPEARGLTSLRYYTFFVGWPRSGHSLFGSLLDAHPSFAIAHELDALPLIDAGFSREQLCAAILNNCRRFAASQGGRGWSGYSYAVPGQWQGRYGELRVIGDKKGGMSAHYLASVNPGVIGELRSMGLPVKVILYHRNPFDIIATVARRAGSGTVEPGVVHAAFQNLVPAVDVVRSQFEPGEILELYHEDLVADPQPTLERAIGAFGEMVTPEYLTAAASIVGSSPRKTRAGVTWRSEVIRLVEDHIHRHSYLGRYDFDS